MDWWWGECPYSTKTREVLGNPSPPPSTLETYLELRSQEISQVLGNLLGVRDGFPNTSLVLVEHGYNPNMFLDQNGMNHWKSLPAKCQMINGSSISMNNLNEWIIQISLVKSNTWSIKLLLWQNSSVLTVQTHRQSENLKVWHCDWLTDWLTG